MVRMSDVACIITIDPRTQISSDVLTYSICNRCKILCTLFEAGYVHACTTAVLCVSLTAGMCFELAWTASRIAIE